MDAKELILRVKEWAGLRSPREAEHAVRATLASLGSALAADDSRALSAALPAPLGTLVTRHVDVSVRTSEDLYRAAEQREGVRPGFAREHVQAVLEVLASVLELDLLERMRKHLPPDIAALLRVRELGGEPPPHVHVHPAQRPTPVQTLSRSRPGTAEPIAETRHPVAHAGSIARTDAAHTERMVETARSTRPAREDETLASAREEKRRR